MQIDQVRHHPSREICLPGGRPLLKCPHRGDAPGIALPRSGKPGGVASWYSAGRGTPGSGSPAGEDVVAEVAGLLDDRPEGASEAAEIRAVIAAAAAVVSAAG